MYYILTLSTGQPVILYQENEKIYFYSIANGRINTKKLLFNDYKDSLIVLNNKYIFYQTINNNSKLFKIANNNFNLLFTLPANARIFNFKKEIFILYQDHDSLYCIKCSTYNKSSLILKGILQYDVGIMSDFLLLKTSDMFYTINSDIKVSKLEFNSTDISYLEKMLQKKERELSLLKIANQNITEQYNELSSYTGKLQEEIRKYRYTK